ncbi:MAG: TniQ family protein [Arcobacteraceae bacterium]
MKLYYKFKYPIKVKPFKNESIISWMIRTSFLNGVDPKSLSQCMFNSNIFLNRDFDRYINPKAIKSILKYTYISDKEIAELTLQYLIDKHVTFPFKLNKYTQYKWLQPITKRAYKTFEGFYYCPLCLKHNSYLKLSWRFRDMTICEEHNIELINRCPYCDEIYDPRNNSYTQNSLKICANCNQDLTKVEAPTICRTPLNSSLESIVENIKNTNNYQKENKNKNFVLTPNSKEKVESLYQELLNEL